MGERGSGLVALSDVLPAVTGILTKRRERFFDTPDQDTPRGVREVQRHNTEHFGFLYPLCLHRLTLQRSSLDALLCHSIQQRAVHKNENEVELMNKIGVTFDLETYHSLIAEAERSILDYQLLTSEKKLPRILIHQGALTDAYRGDLQLLDFLTYAGVRSILHRKPDRAKYTPQRITIKQVTRRIQGFTTLQSFERAVRAERVPVELSYQKVRRCTLRLARQGFFQRATCGLWTWYADRSIMQTCGIRDLHDYALSIALRNKKRALQRTSRDQQTTLLYRDGVRRLEETFKVQRQCKAKAVQTDVPVQDLDQLNLPFEMYRSTQLKDERSIRHRFRHNGENLYAVQPVADEWLDKLRSVGVEVL